MNRIVVISIDTIAVLVCTIKRKDVDAGRVDGCSCIIAIGIVTRKSFWYGAAFNGNIWISKAIPIRIDIILLQNPLVYISIAIVVGSITEFYRSRVDGCI